jgi:hypothetical protein
VHSLATLPEARHRGHCRALLREAGLQLAAAGVPRLVIMYQAAVPGGDGAAEREDRRLVGALEAGFRRKLGFEELSIPLLAELKACFSEYHRDLTRGMAYLSKSLITSHGQGRAQ